MINLKSNLKSTANLRAKKILQVIIRANTTNEKNKNNKVETVTTSNYEICAISDSIIDSCKPEPKVVIIGAGIAGLSAAQRLAQCGFNQFIVLEATERLGGRIHSCWLGDVIAEMGAQYIEGGCIGNPVFNLAAQEGLLKPPIQRTNQAKQVFCTSDGRPVNDHVVTRGCQIFNHLKQEAENLFQLGFGKEHGSLMDFLSLRIQQEIQNIPEEQRYDTFRILYGLINLLQARIGDDLSNVSADNFGSYIPIPGGQVLIPLGFIGVISPLIRDLPNGSIKFKKPVGTINWSSAHGKLKTPRALVICCDGEEIPTDYVIVTVSLGVLKEHALKLFDPPLPENKMEAINSLGFGIIDKIFLDYDRPFWVWQEGSINLAWSPEELSNRTDWTKGLSKIEEVPGSKHLLVAHICGAEAAIMEHASDEEVAERITSILRQFTGDASLPYPSQILRSKWATDPFFYGSQSYVSINANVGHQCDLSCPVPESSEAVPILLFAGEATCAGHHSTVHGARLSGIREAERIIQLTRKYGSLPT